MSRSQPSWRQRSHEISQRLGRRKLVFFGTRGMDGRPLLQFDQFRHCVSLVAPLCAVSMPDECCLETLTGLRVDLDTYHTDGDHSKEAGLLHESLLRACDEPSVLITYRPAEFLTSVYLPRTGIAEYLGLFDGLTAMLEHKPFVETSLRSAGVSIIDWSYFADEDMPRLAEAITRKPHVLRVNRSSGGKGLVLARTPDELQAVLPVHSDRFIGASPYLEHSVPLCIGACVFPDGSVTMHTPSIQLIGLDCCTARQFGHCGNDWGAIRDLDRKTLDELEEMALVTGRWLHRMAYVGAFGIDALLHQGAVLLSEINVRFLGSSAISAQLDSQMDLPDIYCDHIAAFLNLPASSTMRVRDLVREQAPVSQIVCHNPHAQELVYVEPDSGGHTHLQLDLLPAMDTRIAQDAILFRTVVDGSITSDGLSLSQDLSAELERLKDQMFAEV